jgi:hypothetical protein
MHLVHRTYMTVIMSCTCSDVWLHMRQQYCIIVLYQNKFPELSTFCLLKLENNVQKSSYRVKDIETNINNSFVYISPYTLILTDTAHTHTHTHMIWFYLSKRLIYINPFTSSEARLPSTIIFMSRCTVRSFLLPTFRIYHHIMTMCWT